MALKDTIISMLEKNKGKEINGQNIADECGVSRAAVWKAIQALKTAGYPISATRNKGYLLESKSDIVSPSAIRQFLNESISKTHIEVLPTVTSTNDYAKALITGDEFSPSIIVALEQTAGKGRHGHNFYSPKDTGIYVSFTVKPTLSPSTVITTAAAVAVCMACEEVCGFNPTIKWVNDVFLGKKKVCGILTEGIINMETQQIDVAVIGIGINITTKTFPKDVSTIAGSLNCKNLSRNRLIGRLATHLNALMSSSKETVINEYEKRLMVIGKQVSYTLDGETKSGIAVGINENGNLLVKTPSGTDTLTAGEISISKDFLGEI